MLLSLISEGELCDDDDICVGVCSGMWDAIEIDAVDKDGDDSILNMGTIVDGTVALEVEDFLIWIDDDDDDDDTGLPLSLNDIWLDGLSSDIGTWVV